MTPVTVDVKHSILFLTHFNIPADQNDQSTASCHGEASQNTVCNSIGKICLLHKVKAGFEDMVLLVITACKPMLAILEVLNTRSSTMDWGFLL